VTEAGARNMLGDAFLQHLDRAAGAHPTACTPHTIFDLASLAIAECAHDLQRTARAIEAGMVAFLAFFAHHKLQIPFVPLLMASKKTDLPGVNDTGHVITLLQEETAVSIDEDRACKFTETPGLGHSNSPRTVSKKRTDTLPAGIP
jgi:hypothetical protein